MHFKRKKRQCSTVLHESNYAKLLYVIPSVKNLSGPIRISTAGNKQFVEIRVEERTKYTSTLTLSIRHTVAQPWLKHLTLSIRLYYDAHVAEVLSFQSHRRFEPSYQYPNPHMFHRNEKQQLNHFLAEWLDYCIKQRYIFKEPAETIDI